MNTRPPPPSGPPPRYTAVVRKVYPYSLRPIVIFLSLVGFIYGLALGIDSITDINDDLETYKMQAFDMIVGIMYLIVAVIEAFIILVAALQSLSLARSFIVVVPIGLIVNLAANVVGIVAHFTTKSDLIAQCVYNEDRQAYSDMRGIVGNIITNEATSICTSLWNRGTWGVFIWLFVTLVLSIVFASAYLSYYHQLLDPSSVRTRQPIYNRQNQSYPLQSGPGGYHPPPPIDGQQAWMVPPYPGPPNYANNPPPPRGWDKSDYHPEAEWAQADYTTSSSRERDIVDNREEEEAWERAQSQGVTAHLTGHAPSRAREDVERDSGYVIPNAEEDEAWERARNQGVTAHLTGAATGRDRERDV
ncbi:hypothetical protein AYX14_04486 [Cryptococcus neoformans]|nr:hypothetical protein AYX14_04486 [Cryptococcus neoformans var. grubii]